VCIHKTVNPDKLRILLYRKELLPRRKNEFTEDLFLFLEQRRITVQSATHLNLVMQARIGNLRDVLCFPFSLARIFFVLEGTLCVALFYFGEDRSNIRVYQDTCTCLKYIIKTPVLKIM
jgi:hypothetical protein